MHDEHDAADAVGLLLHAPTPEGGRYNLELHHVWGNVVLSSRWFGRDEGVRLGAESGDHWRFLGVDMGFVPRPVAAALRAVPLWSDLERTWRSDFVVPPDLLGDEGSFELVSHEGGAQVLTVPPGWEALFVRDGAEVDADTLVAAGEAERGGGSLRVPLRPGLRFAVRGGEMVVVGGYAPVAARVAQPRMAQDDLSTSGLLGAGVVLAAAVALVTSLVGPPERSAAATEVDQDYVVMVLERTPPPPPVPVAPATEDQRSEARSARHADPERSPRKPRSRDHDRRVAENAGVLGGMSGELDELLGSSSLSAGLVSGVSGLIGSSGSGFDGLSRRGDGLSGGGDAESLGGFGPVGHSIAPGTGPGGHKTEGEPLAGTGDPLVIGTLHASEIDEVVKRNMSQIRYCYQRELQRHPDLGGKVVVKFTIASDGSVSSSATKSSTLDGGDGVTSCLQGRFQRMQFPEPRGGGIVIVSYPLVFSAH